MGFFNGLSEAKPTTGGKYLPVGTALLRCQSIKADTKEGNGEKYFVAEFELLHTIADCDGLSVGETAAFYQGFKYPDSAMGNIRALMHALIENKLGKNVPIDDVDDDLAEAACGTDQIFEGCVVKYSGFQKNGKSFTHCRFMTPSDDDLNLLS